MLEENPYIPDTKINNDGNTWIHRAILNNMSYEAIHNMFSLNRLYCLKERNNVNIQNRLGQTPLHLAANATRVDLIELFTEEYGANVNVMDNIGLTPLHIACMVGHEASIEELVKQGADTQAMTKDHKTPLALFNGDYNLKQEIEALFESARETQRADRLNPILSLCELVQKGSYDAVMIRLKDHNQFKTLSEEVNRPDDSGNTALHYAAYYGYARITAALIVGCANVNYQNKHGDTPLHLATGVRQQLGKKPVEFYQNA